MAPSQSWLVAETLHKEEARALSHLYEQSFAPYLACFRERPNARGVRRISPLFPGYIFVKNTDRWRHVNSTRGVRRVMLTADGTPSLLSHDVVSWIQANEDELGYVVVASEEPPAYSLHQAVMATSGMFREKTGKFVRRTSQERCKVLFEMMGKSVESEMLIRDLVPQQ